MGFAFRKLYPSPYKGCCGVVCPCVPPCEPTTNIVEICVCPLEIVTAPCSQDPPVCAGQRCVSVNYWTGSGNTLDLELCVPESDVQCDCEDMVVTTCTTWQCQENPPETPECCFDFGCFDFPYTYNPGTTPITRTIFNECVVSGATPYTYKIENLGSYTGDFACSWRRTSANPRTYETFTLADYATDIDAIAGDPAFTTRKDKQRFFKTPKLPNGITHGATAAHTPYCIKLHSTASQTHGIENRTMVISGRNVYRYTGHFSGDPYIRDADPFWDSPGGSGIKQYEQLIDDSGEGDFRQFPLSDSFLQLPLWGQESNNNLNITSPDPCARLYAEECDDNSGIPICWGCHCLRNGPAASPAVGHYMTNDWFNAGSGTQGYTAGYFSFSSFNPESYLDDYDTTSNVVTLAGVNNRLGFGNIGDFTTHSGVPFNCDAGGENCIGCSGATSHGQRLGVPTCSVWSLVNALYARVFYAVRNNYELTGSLYQEDEATFRSTFSNFTTAVSNLLSDDPSGTINGTSKVQYHLAKVAEALQIDSSAVFFGSRYFRFIFPNVFLWNIPRYNDVSGSEKWKHLIVVGNGNVLYDSRSLAVNTPYADLFDSTLLHEDIEAQNYLSSVFYLNEVNHQKWRISEASNHARMIVFPGSGGPITVFENPSTYRRNAQAKISLSEMPICGGFTATDDESGFATLSLCSICNALPDPVCRPAGTQSGGWNTTGTGINTVTQSSCSPVDMFTDGAVEFLTCGHIGGRLVEANSVTASYQI